MSPQDTLKTFTHGQRMDLWRTQEELKPMKDVIHTWCLHYRLKSYLIICYGLPDITTPISWYMLLQISYWSLGTCRLKLGMRLKTWWSISWRESLLRFIVTFQEPKRWFQHFRQSCCFKDREVPQKGALAQNVNLNYPQLFQNEYRGGATRYLQISVNGVSNIIK